MLPIPFFKLQAKNLLRDYKTQYTFVSEATGFSLYGYSPKFFDIDGMIVSYDIDEDNFSLMKAQHYIASLSGFYKWTALLEASPKEKELGKLLFEYQNEVNIEDWQMYISGIETDNDVVLDADSKTELFKRVVIDSDTNFSDVPGYLLEKRKRDSM